VQETRRYDIAIDGAQCRARDDGPVEVIRRFATSIVHDHRLAKRFCDEHCRERRKQE